MREYEIRILCANRNTDMFIEVMHLNDHAAIRAAKKFAGSSPFEVWRGLDCIYDGGQTKPPLKAPSDHPPAQPTAAPENLSKRISGLEPDTGR
jgi:hypothetical protein